MEPRASRTVAIPDGFDVTSTIRGTKDPVIIGPTESWWSTRTPEGTGTLGLQRSSPTTLEATAWGGGAEWLLEQTPRLLGADDDIGGFEPPGKLGDLWRRRPFLMGRTDRPWDALVGAIFGQKVQAIKAKQSRRALARTFGERAPGPKEGWILPSPETVAQLGYHDFHRLGVERKRAETLIRTARELRRMSDLTSRSPAQVQERLQHIRGIGAWTSAMVTATAMGDADAVPVGDFHMPNVVAWHLAGEPRATDARMLELLEPYAGHRWRVIRLAKASGSAPKYGPKLSLNGSGLQMGR